MMLSHAELCLVVSVRLICLRGWKSLYMGDGKNRVQPGHERWRDEDMDKREFLKASGAFLASTMLTRGGTAQTHDAARTNWSGNYTYSTDKLDQPANAAEVQNIVKGRGPMKALGARHSFNGNADSTREQISLNALDSREVNAQALALTV